jgi:uncharacterized protein (DUF433 family)
MQRKRYPLAQARNRRKIRSDPLATSQKSLALHQQGAAMIDYHSIITLEPGKRGGKPCIRGLRITVQDVLEWLASGMEVADIIADYPELVKEDIMACLAYAADSGKHAVWVKAA